RRTNQSKPKAFQRQSGQNVVLSLRERKNISRTEMTTLRKKLVQADRILSKLATIVAGADRQDIFARGRFDGGAHRCGDRWLINAVDNNLVSTLDALDQLRLNLI